MIKWKRKRSGELSLGNTTVSASKRAFVAIIHDGPKSTTVLTIRGADLRWLLRKAGIVKPGVNA